MKMEKFKIIKNHSLSEIRGQSLMEVLIGLAIVAVIIAAAAMAISFGLQSNKTNQRNQVASSLAQQLADKVKAISDANWNDIYNLAVKSSSSQYYVNASGTALTIASGTATTSLEGIVYTLFFSVENVCRSNDASSTITSTAPCPSGSSEDPSTQKITVYTRWPAAARTGEIKFSYYLSRWKNRVFKQSDWSGGAGQEGPITEPNNKYATSSDIDASASGVIKIQGF